MASQSASFARIIGLHRTPASPAKKKAETTEEDWYIPYNGPYEAPREPSEKDRPRRDSWGDLIDDEGDHEEQIHVLADHELVARYGVGQDEPRKGRSRYRSLSAFSGRTMSSAGAVDPSRGSFSASVTTATAPAAAPPRRSNASSGPQPPSYNINLGLGGVAPGAGTGGVGESPVPHVPASRESRRISLASIFGVAASFTKPSSPSPSSPAKPTHRHLPKILSSPPPRKSSWLSSPSKRTPTTPVEKPPLSSTSVNPTKNSAPPQPTITAIVPGEWASSTPTTTASMATEDENDYFNSYYNTLIPSHKPPHHRKTPSGDRDRRDFAPPLSPFQTRSRQNSTSTTDGLHPYVYAAPSTTASNTEAPSRNGHSPEHPTVTSSIPSDRPHNHLPHLGFPSTSTPGKNAPLKSPSSAPNLRAAGRVPPPPRSGNANVELNVNVGRGLTVPPSYHHPPQQRQPLRHHRLHNNHQSGPSTSTTASASNVPQPTRAQTHPLVVTTTLPTIASDPSSPLRLGATSPSARSTPVLLIPRSPTSPTPATAPMLLKGKDKWLSPETWCDILLPRPKLRTKLPRLGQSKVGRSAPALVQSPTSPSHPSATMNHTALRSPTSADPVLSSTATTTQGPGPTAFSTSAHPPNRSTQSPTSPHPNHPYYPTQSQSQSQPHPSIRNRIVSPPGSPLGPEFEFGPVLGADSDPAQWRQEYENWKRLRDGGVPSRVLEYSRSMGDLRRKGGAGGNSATPVPMPMPVSVQGGGAPGEFGENPRPRSWARDDLELPPPVPSLAHVLEEGIALEAQRRAWQRQAQSSLGNKHTRSLSRTRAKSLTSRAHPPMATGTSKHHSKQGSIEYLAAQACLGNQNIPVSIVDPEKEKEKKERKHASTSTTTTTTSNSAVSPTLSLSFSKGRSATVSGKTHSRGHSRGDSWSKRAMGKLVNGTVGVFGGSSAQNAPSPSQDVPGTKEFYDALNPHSDIPVPTPQPPFHSQKPHHRSNSSLGIPGACGGVGVSGGHGAKRAGSVAGMVSPVAAASPTPILTPSNLRHTPSTTSHLHPHHQGHFYAQPTAPASTPMSPTTAHPIAQNIPFPPRTSPTPSAISESKIGIAIGTPTPPSILDEDCEETAQDTDDSAALSPASSHPYAQAGLSYTRQEPSTTSTLPNHMPLGHVPPANTSSPTTATAIHPYAALISSSVDNVSNGVVDSSPERRDGDDEEKKRETVMVINDTVGVGEALVKAEHKARLQEQHELRLLAMKLPSSINIPPPPPPPVPPVPQTLPPSPPFASGRPHHKDIPLKVEIPSRRPSAFPIVEDDDDNLSQDGTPAMALSTTKPGYGYTPAPLEDVQEEEENSHSHTLSNSQSLIIHGSDNIILASPDRTTTTSHSSPSPSPSPYSPSRARPFNFGAALGGLLADVDSVDDETAGVMMLQTPELDTFRDLFYRPDPVEEQDQRAEGRSAGVSPVVEEFTRMSRVQGNGSPRASSSPMRASPFGPASPNGTGAPARGASSPSPLNRSISASPANSGRNGVPWDIPLGLRSRRTGSGLTSLARQLSEELEMMAMEREQEERRNAAGAAASGPGSDASSSPGVASFNVASRTGSSSALSGSGKYSSSQHSRTHSYSHSFGSTFGVSRSRKGVGEEGSLRFVFEGEESTRCLSPDLMEGGSHLVDDNDDDADNARLAGDPRAAFEPSDVLPEDVRASVTSSMMATREVIDEEETAMLRMPRVEAMSTPPILTANPSQTSYMGETARIHHHHTDHSQHPPPIHDSPSYHPHDDERYDSHSPMSDPRSSGRILSGFGLISPLSDMARSSYMTTSTLGSRMSGLSDFPIPPRDHPTLPFHPPSHLRDALPQHDRGGVVADNDNRDDTVIARRDEHSDMVVDVVIPPMSTTRQPSLLSSFFDEALEESEARAANAPSLPSGIVGPVPTSESPNLTGRL